MTRRQFGTIRKLPSGRWQARYRLADGRQISARGTFATKAEASHWLAQRETEYAAGVRFDPFAGEVKLGEYARLWLAGKVNLAPRTREIYGGQLEHHILPVITRELPALGAIALSDLTPGLLRSWYAELSRVKGQSIAAKAYTRLRQILNQAVDDDVLVKNPCRIDKGGVERHPEQRFATIEELYRLATEVSLRYRALVLTAGLAGLRQGELFALRRGDVDLQRSEITVRIKRLRLASGEVIEDRPKSEAGRRVVALPTPLALELAEHFARYVGPGREDYVFTSSTRQPLDRTNFRQRIWLPAASSAGLADLRFHDLRHTAGTLAARTGATTRELMARLGHSSASAAMVYQHAAADRDRLIAERLGQMVASAGVLDSEQPETAPTETTLRHIEARLRHGGHLRRRRTHGKTSLPGTTPVVGTGVDPVTSRFSGARSAN